MRLISKPQAGEFPAYASMYINLMPDDERVLAHMDHNLTVVRSMVKGLSEEALTTPFADGEWTIKEILVHIIDDERIYAYRALCFARGDETELPGFDPDAYAITSNANHRTLDSILREYDTVRMATISLFDNFDDEALMRKGIGNKNLMSVRAAAYHIAGHEEHHLNSIRENYL